MDIFCLGLGHRRLTGLPEQMSGAQELSVAPLATVGWPLVQVFGKCTSILVERFNILKPELTHLFVCSRSPFLAVSKHMRCLVHGSQR